MRKRLFIILLFSLFFSCSEKNEPTPVVYTSLIGEWSFKGATVSGTFKISDFSGKLSIDDSFGSFTINGKTSLITKKYEVTIDGFKIVYLAMIGADIKTTNDNFLSFSQAGEYSSDYKTMTFSRYQYNLDGVVINDAVTATRTK